MYELGRILRNTTPSGSPFQQELARLYMDFASQDEKGYDWFNSWYFADKGLRAAYGKDGVMYRKNSRSGMFPRMGVACSSGKDGAWQDCF